MHVTDLHMVTNYTLVVQIINLILGNLLTSLTGR